MKVECRWKEDSIMTLHMDEFGTLHSVEGRKRCDFVDSSLPENATSSDISRFVQSRIPPQLKGMTLESALLRCEGRRPTDALSLVVVG